MLNTFDPISLHFLGLATTAVGNAAVSRSPISEAINSPPNEGGIKIQSLTLKCHFSFS